MRHKNIHLNTFLKIATFLAVTLIVINLKASETKTPSKQPNIIMFLVDDMGWQETSVPFYIEVTALNKRYHTPNMDRLAKRGIKFTQAYACAVCSPSRISLMTGLNAARHKVTTWTLRKDKSPEPEHKTLIPPAWHLNGICAEPGIEKTTVVTTLPMILRKNGYKTIHTGKAHFGAKDTPGENPLNLGFDVNIGGHAAGGPGSYYGKNNFSAEFRKGDRIWDIPGLDEYHGTDIYLNEALTIKANHEIDKAVEENKPFYLYMAHYAIHAPWEKDFRFYDKYKAMGLTDFQATYASMVESMDKSLGDLMQNIRRHGIEENTIIVFMSDNGQPSQADRNLPLRGHKLTPYEGGVRVPLIVDWPGVTNPNSISENYVIIEDLFPTLLEMAGVEKYHQVGGVIDGKSFVPFLKGESDPNQNRPIFWHYPNTYDQPPYSSVRQGDWKLIYQHVTRKLELYNIKNDISEKSDLVDKEPLKLSELANVLTDFLLECEAQLPKDKVSNKIIVYPNEIISKN
ncbi:MAG: sulfatase [Bacteroidetes bacterium]|nr:sulfatase [Bacteroidota bacterium]